MSDDLHVSVSLPSPTVFWRVEGAELGAVVRARRLARRQSIEALAGDAGMHPTYLSMIERGLSNPTWGKLTDLAEAFDVPVSVLAREAEDYRIERVIRAKVTAAYHAARTNAGKGSADQP
jgi:transcriptional regulator with XRE-family HTH domain